MPPVKRSKAAYRIAAEQLLAGIKDGTYAPGSQFPSQPDLAAQFGLSEPVINQAVSLLVNRGYLNAQRGVGTFVRKIQPLTHDLTSRSRRAAREAGGAHGAFQAEVERSGMRAASDVDVDREVPPPEVARILGLEDGDLALVRRRRQYADGVPSQWAPSWYRLDVADAAGLGQEDTGQGGTRSRLAEHGYPVVGETPEITVRDASEDEAAFLGTGLDEPVIEILRTAWAEGDRAVEVTMIVAPAYQFKITGYIPVD